MPAFQRIYEIFRDELAIREVKARVLTPDYKPEAWGTIIQAADTHNPQKNGWTFEKEKPLPLSLISFENNAALFSVNFQNTLLRLQWPEDAEFPIKNDVPPATVFNHLFWLLGGDQKNQILTLRWLPCGQGRLFKEPLDIALPESTAEYGDKTPDQLNKTFNEQYVFAHKDRRFIFLETYISNRNDNLRLYGRNRRADIEIKDGKWRIVREIPSNKEFPRKLAIFQDLKIAVHPEIHFKERAEVREALEAISADRRSGRDLLSIWEKYAQLEKDRDTQIKNLFGNINFKMLPSEGPGVTRVRLLGAGLQKNLDDYREEFLKSALECGQDRYAVKSLNGFNCEIYDPNDILQDLEKGSFVISTQGAEVVQKRRRRALETFNKNPTRLLSNVLLTMEGQAEKMLKLSRRGAVTEIPKSTLDFLKNRFGISRLTTPQHDAVLMALNTPDIAVIQGPPGTGKSTVVAAICHSLLEREASAGENPDRVILLSSFQNETLEYTAAKITAWGLPTLKIGRETKGLPAEDGFINNMKEHISTELARIPSFPGETIFDLRKKLADLLEQLKNENQDIPIRNRIDLLLRAHPLDFDEESVAAWQDLYSGTVLPPEIRKAKKAIQGLRTESASYKDDGFRAVRTLLYAVEPALLSAEDQTLLKSAPTTLNGDEPSEDFLDRLRDLRDKLLENIQDQEERISGGTNPALRAWLEETLESFRIKIETSFHQPELYLRSVLLNLLEDLDGNPDYIREALTAYSQSLAATNQLAGSGTLASILGHDSPTVKNVILEEAARSNPLDLLIPMTKARERLILVGDQNQLPHLLEDDLAEEAAQLSSAENAKEKLQESLFGIIFNNLEKASPPRRITLDEQFRMHPFIGDFISRIYYEGQLKSALPGLADQKRHKLSLPWVKNKVAVFCDVRGHEEPGKSKARRPEAERIFELLNEMKDDPDFRDRTVGIITFYARQVDVLFKEAAKDKHRFAVKGSDGKFEIAPDWQLTAEGREKLRIGTVDSFQGQEFDIVFLSTVRSNDFPRNEANANRIFGFLALPNRLNVAFSRAQRLLIVVGEGRMFDDDLARRHVTGLHEFYTVLSTHETYGWRL